MAVITTYEIFDLIHGSEKDYKIQAKDKNNSTQTIVTSENTINYIIKKYATRKYNIILGRSATIGEGETDFNDTFRMWILNRQHNIDKMYQALFDYNYSPIENVDRYEIETTANENETTYGRTDTKSGTDSTTYGRTNTKSGTDSTTYGRTDTKSGTDSTTFGKIITNDGEDVNRISGDDTIHKSGTETVTTNKAGFNAPNTFTPSEQQQTDFNNRTESTEYGKIDTTDFGKIERNSGSDSITYGEKNTQGGSDSITYGEKNTQGGSDSITYGEKNTQGGSDNFTSEVERELHVHGNIGVTTNNQLIESEIKMRTMSLAELLIDNFINDFTFYS